MKYLNQMMACRQPFQPLRPVYTLHTDQQFDFVVTVSVQFESSRL